MLFDILFKGFIAISLIIIIILLAIVAYACIGPDDN